MGISKGISTSLFVTAGLLTMTGFSLAILSNPQVSAVDVTGTASANATVTVAEACTMESGGTNDSPHTATIPAGTLKENIGLTTFRVICNDSAGFSVYAVGFANYEYGNTKLLATISGNLNPTYDIVTGLATSGNTSNWAMKLTAVSGTYAPTIQSDTNGAFTAYHVVPATNTKVATFAGVTDAGSNATGSAFTATYRAYISGTQPAGNYNGKVKYTMVHPANEVPVEPLDESNCPANNVCYAPNSYDVVGTMVSTSTTQPTLTSISANAQAAKQSQTYDAGPYIGSVASISDYSIIRLIAPNYSRSGYGFVGWSPDFEINYSSDIYGPEETIDKPASIADHGLILYPVWVESTGTIQNWNYCNNLTQANYNSTTGKMEATLDSVTALTDQRDGNVYAVARLADGNCWMIENLRLDAENSSDSSLAQGFGGVFAGLADSENANFIAESGSSHINDATPANSLYYAGTRSGTASVDISQNNYAGLRMPRYNNSSIDRSLSANHNENNLSQWYSYGNYYTWAAAMANTNYYSSPTAQVDGKTSEIANTSICPAGWGLPYGRSTDNGATDGGFSYLDVQMGGSGVRANDSTTPTIQERVRVWHAFPNNIFSASDIYNDNYQIRGRGFLYWSSTAGDYGTGAYYFGVGNYGFEPGTDDHLKAGGATVRCVLHPSSQ